MERQIVIRTRYGGMEYSDVRQRPAGARRAAGPGFEPNESKLRRPPTRPGTIARSSLVGRLARDDLRPIVSLVAPSGYGKTTLLSQWAQRSGQAFAWVSVDERDNDPKVLLSYVAEALDRVQPVGERVFEALASPVSSVPGSVVPRLGSAFWSMNTPLVLVLDDVHLLHKTESRDALSVLADHVPGGSRLVLAGRNEPPLRIARLRAEGRISEIGPGDLSLTREEATSLLRAAGVRLGDDDLATLHQRTEGWPAGLYLAALYLREGGSLGTASVSFGGDDRLVSQYMEAEFLARVSQRHRVFLTRTAVLERMYGPLCEAVLELPGSAATLAELSRSNLLLVPLDRRRMWYRYHHLFRDMLLAELERVEPGLMPVLRRRAAGWCLRHGRPEEALEYFMAAGDVDAAASLVESLSLQGGEMFFEGAISSGEEVGAPDVLAILLCERALLAMERGEWDQAEGFASQARAFLRSAGIEDALACAVEARIAMHRGDLAAARQQLVNAQRVRALLTYTQPHLAVQARIALIRVHLALADIAGARTLMREIDEILKRRPDLGTMVGEAQTLRSQLARERAPGVLGASSLTAAELRVLPLLATHLSFPGIGAEMFLSPHTVKSQAMSIYRKLGASSRHEAVTRARDLGLLEG